MNILSAHVAEVKFGHISIAGLMDENRDYYVGIPQVASKFRFPIKHASRDIKALLGKDFSFPKLKTPLNSKAVNAIKLSDFERLMVELGFAGNKYAQDMTRALVGLSLHQLFSDAFGVNISKQDRQEFLKSRINEAPNPWNRLYEKDACEKAFSWFGANFYWVYCYHWMTDDERAKLNTVNPPINGERKHKIHQYIEKETRERLTPKMQELCVLVDVCSSKSEFVTKYMRRYGQNQLELFN